MSGASEWRYGFLTTGGDVLGFAGLESRGSFWPNTGWDLLALRPVATWCSWWFPNMRVGWREEIRRSSFFFFEGFSMGFLILVLLMSWNYRDMKGVIDSA